MKYPKKTFTVELLPIKMTVHVCTFDELPRALRDTIMESELDGATAVTYWDSRLRPMLFHVWFNIDVDYDILTIVHEATHVVLRICETYSIDTTASPEVAPTLMEWVYEKINSVANIEEYNGKA
jgi:hypothetical protein